MRFAVLLFSLLATANVDKAISTLPTTIEALANEQELSALVALATATKFVDGLVNATNITVFAPNNAALAALVNSTILNQTALLLDVLSYHLLPTVLKPSVAGRFIVETKLVAPMFNKLGNGKGQALLVDVSENLDVVLNRNLKVIKSIATKEGIVHVIDTVLTPPKSVSETAIAANFTLLVKTLAASNLVSTLDNAVGISVFAPTDAAFNFLSSVPTGQALTNVLEYHVIPKIFYSADLLKATNGNSTIKVATLLGGQVAVNATSSGIHVKGSLNTVAAKIIISDVLTNNGVIHVIDMVLLPNSTDSTDTVINKKEASGTVQVTASLATLFGLVVFML